MDWIYAPWPWYVAGPIIALIMFLLLYFGKNFGMSNNLRTMCAIGGGGRLADFFKFDWRSQGWNLVFVVGAILGGFLAANFMMDSQQVGISQDTVQTLQQQLNFSDAGGQYLPQEIFGKEAITSPLGILLLVVAGFMVGFGARYAGGCTSGHAISGLSDLQIPSLIAVVGFFIGGLLMTHLLLPLIF